MSEARYGRLALGGAAGLILAALLGLAAVAWTYAATQPMTMRAGGPPDAVSLAIFLIAWVVMMAAMMFPSVAPVVLVYSQYARRTEARWFVPTGAFVGGYLMSWAGFGVAAYLAAATVDALVAAVPWLAEHRAVALGALIAAAAVYQLTPLKDRCLGRCRTPIHWIFHGFRPGRLGALRMGLTEGVYCVGCCAGLMVVLLGVGISSVAWMGAVAAVIFVEKVLSPTPRVARAIAVGLLVFGLAVAAVPGLGDVLLGPGSMTEG